MTSKSEVIALHRDHPEWNSEEIARALNCTGAYVRATFARNGLQLPSRREGIAPMVARERERCARIAETFGRRDVAAAIRYGMAPSLPGDEQP